MERIAQYDCATGKMTVRERTEVEQAAVDAERRERRAEVPDKRQAAIEAALKYVAAQSDGPQEVKEYTRGSE